MNNRLFNKILKSTNLPAQYKASLFRILAKITEEIISLEELKVDKVLNKELSTNDFTDDFKKKLQDIEMGAQKNVKSNWEAVSGDSVILNKPNLNVYPNFATWDSVNRKIIFKHNNTSLPNMEIDGSDFIKDGMVNDVKISDDKLVITFNVDAGTQPIYIPLKNIFNPNNYTTNDDLNRLLSYKQNQLYSGSNIKTINGESILGSGNISTKNIITNVTWSELRQLKTRGQLISGMKYRITDYQCTTIQKDTQSAGLQFDIIVTADDNEHLNENARACKHESVNISQVDLNKLELKYCLDNDDTKFAWVDKENGKGVIYWMKDEFDNECPYDFINIQFKRYVISKVESSTLNNTLFLNDINSAFRTVQPQRNVAFFDFNNNKVPFDTDDLKYTINEDMFDWYYTFFRSAKGNIIKKCYTSNKIQVLNNIVVCLESNYNIFKEGCHDITLHDNCNYNVFEAQCYNNILMKNCNYNAFGLHCYNNFLVKGKYNTFGNYCNSNTFGNDCDFNTFGNDCDSNTFGNDCDFNTFGNDCDSNTFGNYCNSNTFGNDCDFNTFDKQYTYFITVENGNRHITITSEKTTSISEKLQNFTIAQGVNNTNTVKNITHNTLNDNFKTTYQPANSQIINV